MHNYPAFKSPSIQLKIAPINYESVKIASNQLNQMVVPIPILDHSLIYYIRGSNKSKSRTGRGTRAKKKLLYRSRAAVQGSKKSRIKKIRDTR